MEEKSAAREGGHAAVAGRLRGGLGLVVHAILLCGPQLGLRPHLGSLWLTSIIAAGTLLLLHKLFVFARWNDEMRHVPKFLRALVWLLSVVFLENFCTWATSASDRRKYSYTPLQDNVEIVLLHLFQRYPLFRQLVMGWRVDMHFLLYAILALCLSVAWDQIPYSGFGIGTRVMDAIAWTHLIRTVAFMITVLPNPRPGCYARSFPPVPADWGEYLRIGFLGAKRGSGCNDLVISGHGVVYAVVPLALATYYPRAAWRGGATALAWLAVLKLCMQETVDKTHYSVDMFLAVVTTALVWHWRSPLYPTTATWRPRPPAQRPDPLPISLLALVAGVLVILFVGVAGA